MNVNLLKRRQKMLELRGKGVSLADTVKFLAEEFEVTQRTLYYDWKNRKAWLQTFLEIGDPETFFLDLVSNHKEIYRLASLEYLRGDNSNARIGALRLLRDLNKDFHEMIVTQDLLARVSKLEGKTMEQSEEVKIPELKGLNEEAVMAIVENWMEEEARRLRAGKQPSIQGVDKT